MQASPEMIAQATILRSEIQGTLDDLQHDDPFVREAAIEDLSRRGAVVIPYLTEILSSGKVKYPSSVLRLLGLFHEPRTIPLLKEALRSSDNEVRAYAVEALAKFRDADVLPILVQQMMETEETMQAYIVGQIAKYQASETLPYLGRLLRSKDRELAFHATCALGEIGDKAAGRLIRQSLRKPDVVLQIAARKALQRLNLPVRGLREWSLLLAPVIGVGCIVGAYLFLH